MQKFDQYYTTEIKKLMPKGDDGSKDDKKSGRNRT